MENDNEFKPDPRYNWGSYCPRQRAKDMMEALQNTYGKDLEDPYTWKIWDVIGLIGIAIVLILIGVGITSYFIKKELNHCRELQQEEQLYCFRNKRDYIIYDQ